MIVKNFGKLQIKTFAFENRKKNKNKLQFSVK
jgi:hypothetical protein